MLPSPENALPTSLLAGGWRPSLSVLLAVLGCLAILTGMTETSTPVLPPLGARAPALTAENTDAVGSFHPVNWRSDAAYALHRRARAEPDGRGPAPVRGGSCAVIGAAPRPAPELIAQSPGLDLRQALKEMAIAQRWGALDQGVSHGLPR